MITVNPEIKNGWTVCFIFHSVNNTEPPYGQINFETEQEANEYYAAIEPLCQFAKIFNMGAGQ